MKRTCLHTIKPRRLRVTWLLMKWFLKGRKRFAVQLWVSSRLRVWFSCPALRVGENVAGIVYDQIPPASNFTRPADCLMKSVTRTEKECSVALVLCSLDIMVAGRVKWQADLALSLLLLRTHYLPTRNHVDQLWAKMLLLMDISLWLIYSAQKRCASCGRSRLDVPTWLGPFLHCHRSTGQRG